MNQDEKRIMLLHDVLEEYDLKLFNDYCNFNLLDMFLTKKKKAFLFLELYSLSFSALITEVVVINNSKSILRYKRLYRILLFVLKLLVFKTVVSKFDLIIVNSKLRKKYLNDNGYKKVVVIKNKPLDYPHSDCKKDMIFLTGNLRSLDDILYFAKKNSVEHHLHAVGVNESTIKFVQKEFPLASVTGRVSNDVLMKKLSKAKFGFVSYDGYSTNQILSSSSKLYEMYNSNCIPIINNNPGLVLECYEESIPFINIDDFSFGSAKMLYEYYDMNCHLFSEKKLFSEEIQYLKNYLNKDLFWLEF